MKVKKYTASSIKEALAQIRFEMGDDALIISTREMTAPLGKKFIEVTAASDERKYEQEQESGSNKRKEKSGRTVILPDSKPVTESTQMPAADTSTNRELLSESLKPLKEELFQLKNMMRELRLVRQNAPAQPSADIRPLQEEVKSLKRMFAALSKSTNIDALQGFHENIRAVYHLLINGEVEHERAMDFIEQLDTHLEPEQQKDSTHVLNALRKVMEGSVSTAPPVILSQNKPTIMAFVGPTGVGKTTTIAKLAARCTLQMKKKVCLITIDTYRIAAVEQLKTYAKIMDLPIYVCYNVQDMHKTVAENRDASLILIDTAGHSQADEEQVEDLRKYFKGRDDIDVLLVLSATTKTNDLHDIAEKFRKVGARKLVFTKLDETTTYGPLLNEVLRSGLPMAYFTTGQNVPDDIETATPAKLVKLIIDRSAGIQQ